MPQSGLWCWGINSVLDLDLDDEHGADEPRGGRGRGQIQRACYQEEAEGQKGQGQVVLDVLCSPGRDQLQEEGWRSPRPSEWPGDVPRPGVQFLQTREPLQTRGPDTHGHVAPEGVL